MQQGLQDTEGVVRTFGFTISIEGTEHQWNGPTITTEDIARLGGWDPTVGVVAVDQDNVERTLAPGEVLPLALSLGTTFGRRIRFKRGFTRVERLQAEFDLLRESFPDLEVSGDWVLVPGYPMPEGWAPSPARLAFVVAEGFPGAPPYGIFAPSETRFRGQMPANFTEKATQPVPFSGAWGMFSWTADDDWRPTTSVRSGASLLRFVLSAHTRFKEGV